MRRLVLLFALALGVLSVTPARADSPLSEPSTVLINHDGQHSIRICYYGISLALNATSSAQLVWGTGTTCGTSKVSISPLLQIGSAVTAINNVATAGNGWGFIDENPSRGVSDVCVVQTGGTSASSGTVRYGLF